MSYQITVTVKDGTASVTHSAAPDGVYAISGHVPSEGTWQAEHIQVQRSVPDAPGAVIQASGTHYV